MTEPKHTPGPWRTTRVGAAAPELLEACEEWIAMECEACDKTTVSCDECRVQKAVKAVAKAKGESE